MERDKDGVVVTRYIFIWKVKSLDSSVNKEPALSYPLSTINYEGFSYSKFKRRHHFYKGIIQDGGPELHYRAG